MTIYDIQDIISGVLNIHINVYHEGDIVKELTFENIYEVNDGWDELEIVSMYPYDMNELNFDLDVDDLTYEEGKESGVYVELAEDVTCLVLDI